MLKASRRPDTEAVSSSELDARSEVEVLDMEELGMEVVSALPFMVRAGKIYFCTVNPARQAVWKIEVEDFPAFVAVALEVAVCILAHGTGTSPEIKFKSIRLWTTKATTSSRNGPRRIGTWSGSPSNQSLIQHR